MPSLTTTGLQSGPVGAASVEPLPAAMTTTAMRSPALCARLTVLTISSAHGMQ